MLASGPTVNKWSYFRYAIYTCRRGFRGIPWLT
jgi:hypothetical protein